jgi:hypothetical protein
MLQPARDLCCKRVCATGLCTQRTQVGLEHFEERRVTARHDVTLALIDAVKL